MTAAILIVGVLLIWHKLNQIEKLQLNCPARGSEISGVEVKQQTSTPFRPQPVPNSYRDDTGKVSQ